MRSNDCPAYGINQGWNPLIAGAWFAKTQQIVLTKCTWVTAMTAEMENGPMWQAHQLRATLFGDFPSGRWERSLWHELTDSDPEEIEEKPREGLIREIGQFGDANLLVGRTASRIDIVMSISSQPVGGGIPPETFGEYEEQLGRFVNLVSPWIAKNEYPVTRVALGAVLLLPSEDIEDAYRNAKKYLHSLAVDENNMRDLIYRVNWPTRIDEFDLTVNRITHWSILKVSTIGIGQSGLLAEGMAPDRYFLKLELDHNTVPASGDDVSKLPIVDIYRRLVGLAAENAGAGEIPSAR